MISTISESIMKMNLELVIHWYLNTNFGLQTFRFMFKMYRAFLVVFVSQEFLARWRRLIGSSCQHATATRNN